MILISHGVQPHTHSAAIAATSTGKTQIAAFLRGDPNDVRPHHVHARCDDVLARADFELDPFAAPNLCGFLPVYLDNDRAQKPCKRVVSNNLDPDRAGQDD
jgi:hypothetical protein